MLVLTTWCTISSVHGTAVTIITWPIPVFRLDLTMKHLNQPFLRRALSETTDDIDSTIQQVAETHLAKIYAEEFDTVPSQVLLTVVTDEDQDENNNADVAASKSGIYIRTSFLGGIVSFPTISEQNDNDGVIPTRSELQRVTLNAFNIPGNGEEFLTNLKVTSNNPQLYDGLLLLSASEVKRNDDADSNAADQAKSKAAQSSSSSSQSESESGGGSSSTMNIWAVAAVAALGAMFLVIVLCTSILYCDWRKRKDRRERKREERALAMMRLQSQNGGYGENGMVGSKKGGSSGYTNLKIDNMEALQGNGNGNPAPGLQIVVPNAASGETEEYDHISPSTEGGNNVNNAVENKNFQTQGSSGSGGNAARRSLGKVFGVNKSNRPKTCTLSVALILATAERPATSSPSCSSEFNCISYSTPIVNKSLMYPAK